MTDKVTPLKMLSAETAVRSRLKVRIFKPTVSKDLKSTGGLWNKWSATAIDSEGDTALIFRKFFGSAIDREKNLKKHCDATADGCVVVINPACKSQGCKGSPKEILYNSTSAVTSLEITGTTVLSLQNGGDTAIPKRPRVRKTLAQQMDANSQRRVDVCGIVRNVTTETTEAKNGKDARPFTVVEIIDNSGVGAHLTLWQPLDTECDSGAIGTFLVAYNMKLALSPQGKQLQSTDDTVVMKFVHKDKVNPREDDMIARADGLKAEIPSAFVTFYEGTGTQKFVQGPLRLVCVKTLALAAEVRSSLPEQGFQLEGVYCRLTDEENVSFQNRLWTKLLLTDASGQYSVFATEKALLGMSGLQKDKFIEACKDGSLHLHRSSIRVSRSLRTVHNGTSSQKDYVNLVLEDASPQFLCSIDTSDPSKYGDSATFADAAAILPATLKTLRCDDDGGISVILEAALPRTAEALGGVSLLLRATCAQEPDNNGNNALLRYKGMVDVMTGEKCDVVCLMSLKCALKFLLKVDDFAIFHVTKKIEDGSGTALLAEKVYLPTVEETLEEAKTKFASEITTSAGIVNMRRTLKRERSHLDPECEQEIKETCFAVDSPAKRMCSTLGSVPKRN